MNHFLYHFLFTSEMGSKTLAKVKKGKERKEVRREEVCGSHLRVSALGDVM